MFTQGDSLVDSVNDDFIKDYVLPIFAKYVFLGTRIDALGAVYEVLALRAEKDVKVGQFFTPENVVQFMVKLAELDFKDLVLDPACGTGRFLIYSMNDMVQKVDSSNVRNKVQERDRVRLHSLFGADIDHRIAKIAKMNMWIHGDGKSNIFGGNEYNGLILHKHGFNGHETFDNAFDAVLTNPPLGELNYQVIPFVDPESEDSPEAELRLLLAKFNRMPFFPRRNLTQERLKTVRERLENYSNEVTVLEGELETLRTDVSVTEWLTLTSATQERAQRSRRQELERTEIVKLYKSISSSARSKRRTIEHNQTQAAELEARILTGQIQWEITGNTMKGGAMFVAAIWHYLKSLTYPDSPPEWRGGKMLIILDEGILNTDDYSDVREFLRSHFYIKAIISLTRDTFVPVSKTSTKTSIVYAVKKSDLSAVQREPIFFGHVEWVGLDTKGAVSRNDLEPMLNSYLAFKEKVLSSYRGNEFSAERFTQTNPGEGSIS